MVARKYALKNKYAISESDYSDLLANQNNACAICLQDQIAFPRKLAVDHDHVSGKIRGLLCTRCNLALGCVDDDPFTLVRAVVYLEKNLKRR